MLCADDVTEAKGTVLTCPGRNEVISAVKFAGFGAPTGTCNDPSSFRTSASCNAGNATTIVSSYCLGERKCPLRPLLVPLTRYEKDKQWYGKPRCAADDSPATLKVWVECSPMEINATGTETNGLESHPPLFLSCPKEEQVISGIVTAVYAPLWEIHLNTTKSSRCEGLSARCPVAEECLGERNCTITPTNTFIGDDPCAGVLKELRITAVCSSNGKLPKTVQDARKKGICEVEFQRQMAGNSTDSKEPAMGTQTDDAGKAKSDNTSTMLVLGIFGVVLLFLLAVGTFIFLRRRSRRKRFEEVDGEGRGKRSSLLQEEEDEEQRATRGGQESSVTSPATAPRILGAAVEAVPIHLLAVSDVQLVDSETTAVMAGHRPQGSGEEEEGRRRRERRWDGGGRRYPSVDADRTIAVVVGGPSTEKRRIIEDEEIEENYRRETGL